MAESAESCAFQPCARRASVTLRLLVEEWESVVATCHRHAHWLRGYVEGDTAVRLLDELPEEARPTVADEDAADLT